MDLYSLFTNTKAAELIFNLLIHIIIISLTGWTVMKIWNPRSAPVRSGGYLAVLLALAVLPVLTVMFTLLHITWFQSTISLPPAYTQQSSPAIFQNQQNIFEDSLITDNEIRPDTSDQASVPVEPQQENEIYHGNDLQNKVNSSNQNSAPFITRELIIISTNIFGGIWIAGFVVFILRLSLKLSFLKGYMHNLSTGDTERLKNIYNSIRPVFKNRPMPDIYQSSSLSSPVTIGIIRPVMILPVEMEDLSDHELKSILLHELAHIFHSDNFIGFLQHVLSSIFWWNPLVYYLNSAYSDSREDVCDNYAIRNLKSPKKYAATLLTLAEKTSFLSHMPATAGMSLSKRSFEHRVLDLLRKDRDLNTIYKPSLIILCLITAIAVTSCGTGLKLSFKDTVSPVNRDYIEISKKPVWVIGNEIINKINTDKFKDIEKYVDHLVKEKPYTADGTRVLERLYPFAAERLDSSDNLDKWCEDENPHQASFILRGIYYIYEAWKHRGHGPGYTVTVESLQKFREYLILAKNDLEKAYDINPEDPNSAASMLSVCRGLDLGEIEMETWFERAVEADPVTYKAYAQKQDFIRPKWYGTEEKDKAFAEYCYNSAPSESVIHEIMLDYIIENYKRSKNKGEYFNDLTILKTVYDVAQKTLVIFPDSSSIRSKLAEIEKFRGNYGKAIEYYSEILTIDPGNPEALQKRGNLYSGNLRKYDLAEADIKLSIKSDPYGPHNYEELAKISQTKGDYRQAIEYLNMAINKKPKNPKLYVDRGAIKRRPLREYASALEDFKQAVRLDSNHVVGNFYMALCYEGMRQLEEAEKYRIKTLEIIESRKPGKPNSLPPAFADDIRNKLTAMQIRLKQGSSRAPATLQNLYPKEINYTIDPSPGEGWMKMSSGPFNDLAFNLPSKSTVIYVARIPVFESAINLPPAEIFKGWIDGMQTKYRYKNFDMESSGTATIDGRKLFYAVYEFIFMDTIKKEKVYIIKGDSLFYRLRYSGNKNTFNDNLQTFEDYFKSFKISS